MSASRLILTLIILALTASVGRSQNYDTIPQSEPKRSVVKDYIKSLTQGNIDRSYERVIDMSFALSPTYTHEAGIGVGAMVSGLYRINRNDSTMQPSDVSVLLNTSINGFYSLTVQGNNLFADNKSRLTYKLEAYRKRLDFWGLNVEETSINQRSRYDRRQIDLITAYLYRMGRNWYIGPQVQANYTDACDVLNPAYMLNERWRYYVTGVGASLEFDTRDNLLNPHRGLHFSYQPMYYWKALGNQPASFWRHTVIFNYYQRLWPGGLMAYDLFGRLQSDHTPWTMREMVAADGIRMRGYYMGSYIDNNQVATQMELRQNVYKRLGIVGWVGEAAVFSRLKDFKSSGIAPQWLFNYGLGLRFEFKHNVNLRLDYGFGRHQSGMMFAVGEAF